MDTAPVETKDVSRLRAQAAGTWLVIADFLLRRRHRSAAEACLRRAVALAPADPAPRLRLAALLQKTGQAERALAEFAALRRLAPDDPAVHSAGGQLLIGLGRLTEAEAWLRRALDLDGRHANAHFGLARLRLLAGDFRGGWAAYAGRLAAASDGRPWDGADLAGKTLLVRCDQGFDDTLQFLRFIPPLATTGARLVVVGARPLLRILQGLAGVAQVAAEGTALPRHDAAIALSLLPLRLDGDPAQVPYLRNDDKTDGPTLHALPAPLGTRLKVGLVWVGNEDRALALDVLLPIAGISGVAVYSLQTGPQAGDLKRLAHPALICDLSAGLGDFADAAGLLGQLDLLVTADGAMAHLAGALGKPVWTLIPSAPDWRWGTEGDDSSWYPTMRLFRQSPSGDWAPAVARLVEALGKLAASRPLPIVEDAEIVVLSVFPGIHHGDTEDTEKKELPASSAKNASPCSPCLRGEPPLRPRFRMTAPRSFLADPGIRFLVSRERSGVGYEYATRSFLDSHLRPGNLFLDVGAHWGIMSLQAVTRWPGQIDALAIEALPANLPHLRRWIAENGAAEHVEVIAAAASDQAGRGRLRPESTMGHSLIKAADGPIAVVTLDGLLAERPHLGDRRVIVKIDVEGSEIDVLAGMTGLLDAGRVAAVIWERGIEYDRPDGKERQSRLRRRLAARGFTAWHFASEDEAGPLAPFTDGRDWHGNVFELAPGQRPEPSYGLPRPPPGRQPADPALDAALQARQAFQAGFEAQKQRKTAEASALYAKAAALDGSVPGLHNNLGVLLRDAGRPAAAAAIYRRALAATPDDPSLLSNLGNVLREQGRFAEAAALLARGLSRQPSHPSLLYNAGVIEKDAGRPERAVGLFERALALDPGNADYRWDRALALLQAGNYADGFAAYEARWGLKRAHRRKIALPPWDGAPLEGRSLFLSDEQGFGDVLEFARFIPEAKRRGAGRIIVECQPELMRLMALAPHVDAVVPRAKGVPDADVTAPLLSLPGIFGTTLATLPAAVPYLTAPAPARRLADDGRLRLGLVWAGKPTPRDRSCPLELLLPLLGDPRFAPFSLQLGPRAADLPALGGDALVTDLGPALVDFAETAAILAQLDLLVSIDTAVAHLAGALGLPTFLLLRQSSDWRWFDQGTTSPWYPSMTLFRQKRPNRWEEPIEELRDALGGFADRPALTRRPPRGWT